MHNFGTIAGNFRLKGTFESCEPYGSGHIHETYLLTTACSDKSCQDYILQLLNVNVFREPEKVMHNIRLVTEYLKQQSGITDKYLSVISTLDGSSSYTDLDGNVWRCLPYFPYSITFDKVTDPGIAFEGARMFGHFMRSLEDFDPERLYDTIPGFHDMQLRLDQFSQAVKADPAGRALKVRDEIQKVRDCMDIANEFIQAREQLPVRVMHHDTKINNVLFNEKSLKGLCVIDLDTMMPGTVMSDYGDMVRTFTNAADEDEPDLNNVFCRTDILQELNRGFLTEAGGMLTPEEKDCLLLGGKGLIYMQAVRFLTDYINGDIYYKTSYGNHNLVRARNQFKLLDSLTGQEGGLDLRIMNTEF
ncbi:MAG: aminoglycoside phosphotransferase family protein [Bacteroidales bacterium]|nr:aminoglycoside phosphotransferase family protein [Bacteroidales bacterium]